MKIQQYTSECETGFLKICSVMTDDKGCYELTKCGRRPKRPKLPKDNVCIILDSDSNQVILMDGYKTHFIPHIRTQGTYTLTDSLDLFNLRLNKTCYGGGSTNQAPGAARRLDFSNLSP